MKTNLLKITSTLAVAFVLFAFSTNPIKKKSINTQTSKIEWMGEKLTGTHEGTMMFKEGFLLMDGDKITGGEFIVDMNTLTVTDLSGESKQKLEGHLKSDDFFSVKNHQTATLVIKNATKKGNNYGIIADLTIKGKTNPITFNLELNDNSAQAELTVDRTKYDVKYGSGSIFDNLGDNVIYDDFELDVRLQF